MGTATGDTRDTPLGWPPPAVVAGHGTRYDEATKDLAYQLWAWVHGRNGAAVEAELARRARQEAPEGIEPAPTPDRRTVERWASEDRWAERIAGDVQRLAPAIHRGIVVDVIAGASEAVAHLRAVARGEAKPDPARVRACHDLLAMAGHGKRAPGDYPDPNPPNDRLAHLTDADIDAMSEAELDALLAGEDTPY